MGWGLHALGIILSWRALAALSLGTPRLGQIPRLCMRGLLKLDACRTCRCFAPASAQRLVALLGSNLLSAFADFNEQLRRMRQSNTCQVVHVEEAHDQNVHGISSLAENGPAIPICAWQMKSTKPQEKAIKTKRFEMRSKSSNKFKTKLRCLL